jgi:hypothetical protein
MINKNSIAAVDAAGWSKSFVRPLYGSYCFSGIPATVERLLTGRSAGSPLPTDVLGPLPQQYQKVVLFLVDAFGWRFFERWRDEFPFLKQLSERGVVSKITSIFPSTTAVHVTALHTGLTLKQSGVCEWYYYDPAIDAVIAPLLFSYHKSNKRNSLLAAGRVPEEVLPTSELYPRLKTAGVDSYVFQDGAYAQSPYSRVVCRGSRIVAYQSLADGFRKLCKILRSANSPSYFVYYFDRFDAVCHEKGPGSKQAETRAREFFESLEQKFFAELGESPDTLFLLTADHGQVEQDPESVYLLDREWPELVDCLKKTAAGEPIAPAGSQRDYFLYVEPQHLDHVQARLAADLEGRAEVYRVEELEAAGMFGPGEASLDFQEHMGNLLVLPYADEAVYWGGPTGEPEFTFRGHHGGLARGEMESVLVAWSL